MYNQYIKQSVSCQSWYMRCRFAANRKQFSLKVGSAELRDIINKIIIR